MTESFRQDMIQIVRNNVVEHDGIAAHVHAGAAEDAVNEIIALIKTMEHELIRELVEEIISLRIESLFQGGCYASSEGKPLADEDDILGKACVYLGVAIPIIGFKENI